ncbi:hypothetical protein [Bdellovibrio sp.]|uniref:hypothetical protein n=1 Tax=Bdellovibrio sp. TaxID=28201 RepID=UPI0039E597FA
MKILILGLLLYFSLHAYAENDWKAHSVPVMPDSELQHMIDEITIELFRSPIKEALCTTYMNTYSVYHSLGVSLRAAQQAFSECQEIPRAPSKILRKQYYLSFVSAPTLDSWTDFGNRTYLFVDDNMTREHLKSMLLHEMAISLDAKTNMLYTTYLTYLASANSNTSGFLFIDISNLNDYEKTLQAAFNQATWKPISMTFAALRAFNLELAANGTPQLSNHQSCVTSFMEILTKIKTLPAPPKSEGVDQIGELLAETVSNKTTPTSKEHEAQILEFLLSDRLTLKDIQKKEVTFCQFMTQPLLTGRTLYNLFGAGPRPRLTGGSGGQGGQSSFTSSLQSNPRFQKPGGVPDLSKEDLRLQQAIEQLKKIKEGLPPSK